MEEFLSIKNLKVVFDDISGPVTAVNDVSIDMKKGEILGLIGESGSGKSVTARSIMQLNDVGKKGRISGEIIYKGRDLLSFKEKEICRLRGTEIAMIFQEPMTALNPVMTIEAQLREVLEIHHIGKKEEANERIRRSLEMADFPDPEKTMKKYPFELSGGQRQRVAIAMAIIGAPELIIADEPTTALDVTTQAEILSLLRNVAETLGSSVLLITHDLGVIAEITDRVAVMYRGMVMEDCSTKELFTAPSHPYSKGLLDSRPSNFTGRYNVIRGSVKQNYGELKGCPYSDRCDLCMEECRRVIPEDIEISEGHKVSCLLMERV